MKRIAYIRVSTAEQRPDRQIDGLKRISDELHIETLSAVARRRPVYETVVARLEPGDTLVVWSLDRAFRSARDALNELHALQGGGVQFHIADLSLDTATPHGKLTFTLMSAVAEFERDVLIQRTKEGIAAARARGKRIGRPPKLSKRQLSEARRLIDLGTSTRAELAEQYGVAEWTLSRSLKRMAERPST
ncbi:recombinase family protein [Nitratireductor alexandrii]|uniref:recombinase family protein n=1 Tax=Nitratireductor alexandrii TaxID=2448161 RepID=UPI000FD9D12C|nr:recombinase family protein [Nitratireductor alexandrii]